MSLIDLSPFNTILSRLEGVASRLEQGVAGGYSAGGASSPASAPKAAAVEVPPIVQSYDGFLRDKLDAVEAAANDTGVQDIIEATEFFSKSMRFLREMVLASTICKKPQDAAWAKFLPPALELGQKAQKLCDNRSDFFQSRKAAAEALNLVTLASATSPPQHVQNVIESMDFHAMKAMQKKNDKETAWIRALKAISKDLKDWCTEECKLGLMWNVNGKDPLAYFEECPLGSGGQGADGGKGKGKGPAVPKGLTGPPPELVAKLKAEAGAAPVAAGGPAIFNAIGNFNTGALKKVTDDMKTKNQPKDNAPPAAVPKAAPTAAVPASAVGSKQGIKGPRGPPIKELQKDLNWVIENYDGVPNLLLDQVEKQQLVCIINCRNTTIRISSKVKSICIDGCDRVNIVCEDVVSAVELVNSDRCKVQTLGKVHSFAIDKCNGVNIFLSKASLEAEFVTSKSSEMNVTIPDSSPGAEDGDQIEMPIPEQFVTRLVGPKKLKTEVSSLYTS